MNAPQPPQPSNGGHRAARPEPVERVDASVPQHSQQPPPPRVIIPSTSKRELFIAISAGLLVLAFVVYGIIRMGAPEKGNQLTGIIVGREFTPFKERQVSFTGRKIEGVEEIDGEYLFKVRVEAVHKTYDVPVEKPVYQAKKDGDSFTFIRPPSEQR